MTCLDTKKICLAKKMFLIQYCKMSTHHICKTQHVEPITKDETYIPHTPHMYLSNRTTTTWSFLLCQVYEDVDTATSQVYHGYGHIIYVSMSCKLYRKPYIQ